jgi:hypothetical protein
MYLYLDDEHKACNQKFASLLGYKSPEEWAGSKEPFAQAFVAPKSHKALVTAYQNAVERSVGSAIKVTWKKKDGREVDTDVS